MAGFERNRFIDLNEREENHLKCGICLNIFNNAVNSECGHTFCRQCIHDWINSNHKLCPECRQTFTTRNRSETLADNLMAINSFVFNRNFKVNAIVSELKTKCDFEFNGCQEVLEFGLLLGHLKRCPHRLCSKCGFPFGKVDEHNCLELMRNERNQWKLKYENSEQTAKELAEELQNKTNEWKLKFENKEEVIQKLFENNSYLEKEFNELSDILMNTKQMVLPLSQLTDFVVFGSFKSGAHSLHLFCDGLKLTFVSVNNTEVKLKHNIVIPFLEIEELIYSSDSLLPILVIKTNAKHCLQIQKCLYLGTNSPNDYKFDVNSNDPKHRYIMVKLKEMTEGFNIRHIEYYSRFEKPSIKSQAIDFNKIGLLSGDSGNVSPTDGHSSELAHFFSYVFP